MFFFLLKNILLNKQVILITFLITFFYLPGCKKFTIYNSNKFFIVSTTGLIGDIVQNIGKERVYVKTIIPSGVDPHLYRVRLSDISKIFNAKIIFHNGLNLEAKMGKIIENSGKKSGNVFAVTDKIDRNKLIKDNETNEYDMHVWMDVMLWKEAARYITEILIKFDNEYKTYYENNYKKYEAELIETHNYIKKLIQSIDEQKRVLITAHDAFIYFSRSYKIKVKALQGISTEAETSITTIQALADFIVKNKIPSIFGEATIPKRNILSLQEAVKSRGFIVKLGTELYSDSLGPTNSKENTYIGMMRYNARAIKKSLTND